MNFQVLPSLVGCSDFVFNCGCFCEVRDYYIPRMEKQANPIKKTFGGKKLALNGSKSGNVAPPIVADQEVGLPNLFLTLCLIAQLKRGGPVFIRYKH